MAKHTVQTMGGLLHFAYYRPDGSSFLVKRMPDDYDGPKYLCADDERGLTVHPLVRDRLNDPDVPLVVVEGTKQHLAAVTALKDSPVCLVGLNGIRGWQFKPDGKGTPSKPLPDWRYIPLVGRKVYVVPDGDYDTKPGVRDGADDLMAWLTLQGAEVARVAVPLAPGEDSTGLDDHLEQVPPAERTAALQQLMEEADDEADDFFLDREALRNLPPVEPLIEGMLNQASICWLSGKFGTYKTFVSLAWACSVATGRTWEGHKVHRQGPVVYVAAEGQRGLNSRLQAWEGAMNGGREVTGLIVTPKGLDPRSSKDMARLTRKVKRSGAVMVVFDTLHRCAPGMEENSNKELGEAFGALQRLKDETGVCVLVLHHTGYEGKHARGASSQEDDADDAYVIKFGGDPEDRSPTNPRILVRRKSKEGEAGEELRLKLKEAEWFEGDGAYVTVEPPEESFLAVPRESKLGQLIRLMDENELPLNAGRDRAKAWLHDRGVEFRAHNDTWGEALKVRKGRAEG
ncbi:AAA family ATPase [Streptomyces plumbiresistens]|uniref:AAA family ATPase n=1 Tax=Streptomyces plumbiresistens TaxID=511811 RepID=UPI0031E5D69E